MSDFKPLDGANGSSGPTTQPSYITLVVALATAAALGALFHYGTLESEVPVAEMPIEETAINEEAEPAVEEPTQMDEES